MNLDAKKSSAQDQYFDLILTAVEFIENNLNKSISIKVITQQFEKSHWQFQRLFRGVVGITLGQYLRERRLSEAANRLRLSSDRIFDIALEFDFKSHEAFTRAFKQFFLISPLEFRKNSNVALIEFRHRLTLEKISYFWNHIQRKPEIIFLNEKKLIGLSVHFQSHFVEGTDCAQKVLPHWIQFLKQKHKIRHQVDHLFYGVAISSELQLREKKLNYFAGVEVSDFSDCPENMTVLKIPAGNYACFEKKGLASSSSKLMDYVYGIWLPESGYKRALGYDLEIFDDRYNQKNENSISKFLIPIKNSV